MFGLFGFYFWNRAHFWNKQTRIDYQSVRKIQLFKITAKIQPWTGPNPKPVVNSTLGSYDIFWTFHWTSLSVVWPCFLLPFTIYTTSRALTRRAGPFKVSARSCSQTRSREPTAYWLLQYKTLLHWLLQLESRYFHQNDTNCWNDD